MCISRCKQGQCNHCHSARSTLHRPKFCLLSWPILIAYRFLRTVWVFLENCGSGGDEGNLAVVWWLKDMQNPCSLLGVRTSCLLKAVSCCSSTSTSHAAEYFSMSSQGKPCMRQYLPGSFFVSSLSSVAFGTGLDCYFQLILAYPTMVPVLVIDLCMSFSKHSQPRESEHCTNQSHLFYPDCYIPVPGFGLSKIASSHITT